MLDMNYRSSPKGGLPANYVKFDRLMFEFGDLVLSGRPHELTFGEMQTMCDFAASNFMRGYRKMLHSDTGGKAVSGVVAEIRRVRQACLSGEGEPRYDLPVLRENYEQVWTERPLRDPRGFIVTELFNQSGNWREGERLADALRGSNEKINKLIGRLQWADQNPALVAVNMLYGRLTFKRHTQTAAHTEGQGLWGQVFPFRHFADGTQVTKLAGKLDAALPGQPDTLDPDLSPVHKLINHYARDNAVRIGQEQDGSLQDRRAAMEAAVRDYLALRDRVWTQAQLNGRLPERPQPTLTAGQTVPGHDWRQAI